MRVILRIKSEIVCELNFVLSMWDAGNALGNAI